VIQSAFPLGVRRDPVTALNAVAMPACNVTFRCRESAVQGWREGESVPLLSLAGRRL
jgi:hypothetical protein